MTSPLPPVRAEIAVATTAAIAPAGSLILDDPVNGLLDTGTLAPSVTWLDAGPYARSLLINRPGTRSQGPMLTYQAGTGAVDFDNTDGRFDPDNLAGPYVFSGISQIKAMVPVRFRVSWGGTDYHLLNGFADGWQDANVVYDDGYSEITLAVTDAFKVLQGLIIPAGGAVGSGELSGARVTRILNAAGWYTDHRRIAAGDSPVQSTTFGSDALSLLQLTADTELGEFYIDGTGSIVFRNRHAILTDTRSNKPQAVFGDIPGTTHPAGTELAFAVPGRANDDTTMFNDIQITRVGGTIQEATDAASVTANLFARTYARTDLILTTDAEALNYAQWVLFVAKNAEDRFDTITIDPLADPGNLWPQVLGRDIGDRIQIWRRPQSSSPVVTLYGSSFPAAAAQLAISGSGHTFGTVAVPGWGFGAGVAAFQSVTLPDGKLVITSVPLTNNELKPTFNHAELAVFDPVARSFTRIVIPTSTGALTAVTPGEAIGGTDAGGGDVVVAGGNAIFTCTGYYFGWDLGVTGLYPAVGFLASSSGAWSYSPAAVNFLAGQNSDFEAGIGNWTAHANCTISQTVAQAHGGTHSLQMSSTAAGDMIAGSCSVASILANGMPVKAGQSVLCAGWLRTAASVRSVFTGVEFYDSTGTIIGSTSFGTTAAVDGAASWNQVAAVAATAPANSFVCRGMVKVAATGGAAEIHYVDDVTLEVLGTSLSGDQLELTNPAAFATLNPSQTAGLNGSYWATRGINQMAVFPQSGNIVVGHYFTGNGFNSGCISVISPAGALLAVFQIPSMNRQDGATSIIASPREVKTDPSSAVNDERFFVVYDCFGNSNAAPSPAHVVQEFTYNAGTQTITPKSVPCISADDDAQPQFCYCAADGTLYVSHGGVANGLLARNLAVYMKHSGERALVTSAPATGSWATNGSYATPVVPDYSLGFERDQGLGIPGPLAIDTVTGTILVPGVNGQVGAAVPDASIASAGPNLLSDINSTFETANLIGTRDALPGGANNGGWTVFAGSCTLATGTPPVTPPGPSPGYAMKVTATGNGECDADTGAWPALPNHVHSVSASYLANTAVPGVQCDTWIEWLDSTLTTISSTAVTSVTDGTGSWSSPPELTATSPANTAAARVWSRIKTTVTGQVHWITDVNLYDLTTAWTGFVTTTRLTAKQAQTGALSLAMIAPFSQNSVAAVSPPFSVIPGREYVAASSFRTDAGVPAGNGSIFFTWFDANGAQIGSPATATRSVATSTGSWSAQAYSGSSAPMVHAIGSAPVNAATATITVNVTTGGMTPGQMQFADNVTVRQAPYRTVTPAELGWAALRAAGATVGVLGRPSISGRSLYIPTATLFSPAENAAYSGSYVPDNAHPQYLAAVNIDQLIGTQLGGAVVKDCFIRGIQHAADAAAGTWLTAWTLQDATRYASILTLDSPVAGRLDFNALAY